MSAVRERLTAEEQAMVEAALAEFEIPKDKDFLLEDGNADAFFLSYFPRMFMRWETLNRELLNVLENHSEYLCWIPGGHGKTTTLLAWMIYVMCREPQISFIYIEKNLPTSHKRARALIQLLEGNRELIHDFGEFKGDPWSTEAFTIKQRPEISQWPTCSFYGSGAGGGALGNRCNIILVDDPVTPDNSSSELERARLLQWYNEAASTCPYPLPILNKRYSRKSFLIGTPFHMEDLYHTMRDSGMPLLHLKAVDMESARTLAPTRFVYLDEEDLKKRAEESEDDARLLKKLQGKEVINLLEFRQKKGTQAFMRRYQCDVHDESLSKFPRIWFDGGEDAMSPPGGYPGCYDDSESLGAERYEGWRYVTGVDPAGGGKSKTSVNFACVTLGMDPEEKDVTWLVDMAYGRHPLESDNPAKKTQVEIVLDHVRRYGSRIILETNNVQSAWDGVLRKGARERGMLLTLSGHYTSQMKKVDLDGGIDAMCAMVENGKLRIPYRDPSDKRLVAQLVDEMNFYPIFPTDDVLMAFWLAWRGIERLRRNVRPRVVEPRDVPTYMDRGDEWDLPAHWTPAQKMAFFGLGSENEDLDEDAAPLRYRKVPNFELAPGYQVLHEREIERPKPRPKAKPDGFVPRRERRKAE